MTKAPRPRALTSQTIELPTPCGRIYITITERDGHPFEVFGRLGKSGGCASATVNATCSTLSIALRSGADPADLAKGLEGISCHRPPILQGGKLIRSCVDAIGQAIKEATE